MAPPQTSAVSAVLTIDLAALRSNYRLLQKKASKAQVAGIVKANAYGLGMAEIIPVLERENCPFYFVATPDEALQVRALTQKPVAVFGGLFGAADEFIRHDLIPVINDLHDLALWQKAAEQQKRRLPAVLQFETGMNRQGLTMNDYLSLCVDHELLEGINVLYVMSHFACADEKGHPLNDRQYNRFVEITARFPDAGRSLANSSGLFRSTAYHFELVRPGMALYGLNPTPEADNPMQPVATLNARITQVKSVDKGETIGYGAGYRFVKETTVASVALGYADGFSRALSNKGALYYKGRRCPVVGRVSMDCVTVAVEGTAPMPGEMMEVLGPHQSADDLAAITGTIGYEVLTSLGARYKRRYAEG